MVPGVIYKVNPDSLDVTVLTIRTILCLRKFLYHPLKLTNIEKEVQLTRTFLFALGGVYWDRTSRSRSWRSYSPLHHHWCVHSMKGGDSLHTRHAHMPPTLSAYPSCQPYRVDLCQNKFQSPKILTQSEQYSDIYTKVP